MKTEQKIQSEIIKEYEKKGYFVLKIIKCNRNGFPDLLLLKDGKAFCIEIKRLDGKLSELQKYRIEELKKYGIETLVKTEP